MAALTSAPLVVFFACSWIFVVAKEDVTVKPGEDVPLQCRGPTGAAITLLEWSRTDPKSDHYVFFFRDDRSYEKYQLPSFRGRVQLRDPEMKDGDASVVLKNVTINDTGTYECLVSADGRRRRRNAPEPNNIIKLTVTDSGLTAGHVWDGGNMHEHFGQLPVIGVMIIVFVFFLFWRHKTRKKNSEQPAADEEQDLLKH